MSVEVLVTFGGVQTDVTAYVELVNISRGRPQRYGSFPSGSATIRLNNRDRRFDPLYRSGPYFGNIKPRIPIAILKDEIPLFTGYVDDFELDYKSSKDARAVFRCVDGLALLSQTSLDTFTASQEVAGQRIEAIVNRPEINYAGDVDIDQGQTVLQSDTIEQNENTFGYLQQIAATDLGRLFVDASGRLRYQSRTRQVVQSAKIVFASPDDPLIIQLGLLTNATLWFDASNPEPLTNDGSSAAQGAIELQDATLWFDASDPNYVPPIIPPQTVTVEYGTQELYNRASVSRLNGGSATSTDSVSVIEYGTRTFTQSGTLFLDDAALQPYADYIVSENSQPVFRITGHEVLITGQTDIYARYLYRLEIGDVVRTIWTPTQTGNAQDVTSIVERVTHSISPTSHSMSVTLTPRPSGGFILDSLTDGLLDTSEMTY